MSPSRGRDAAPICWSLVGYSSSISKLNEIYDEGAELEPWTGRSEVKSTKKRVKKDSPTQFYLLIIHPQSFNPPSRATFTNALEPFR